MPRVSSFALPWAASLILLVGTLLVTAPANAATVVLTGIVTDAGTGQPFADPADVSLHLMSTTDQEEQQSASVDAQGSYQFTDLPAGEYRLWVYGPQDLATERYYASQSQTVTLGGGTALVRDVSLKRAPVAIFTVLTADGSALSPESPDDENVTLRVKHAEGVFEQGTGWAPPQSGPHTTDSQGRYVVSALRPTRIGFRQPGTDQAQWWAGSGDQTPVHAFDQSGTVTLDPDMPTVQHHTVRLTAQPPAPGIPRISGTVSIGQTLSADPAPETWPGGTAFRYQWTNSGFEIPGATDRELTLGSHLPGVASGAQAQFSVRVTGSHPGGGDVDAYANLDRGPVGAGDPPVTPVRPTISGTTEVGQTLTAGVGEWGPAGVDVALQWLADDAPIAEATGATLTLTDAQLHRRISLRATGTKAGYSTVVRESVATTAVVPGPVTPDPLTPGTVTIAGAAVAGRTLTVRTNGWGPEGVRLSRQWLADGIPIAGASGTALGVTNTLAGKRLQVRVTGTFEGSTATVTSLATAPVTGRLSGAKPGLKGKTKVGKKLKAKVRSLSPRPVTVKYRWLRNGKVISGAKKATYKLTRKDRGKRIQVRVIVTRTHFQALKLTSAKTKKIAR